MADKIEDFKRINEPRVNRALEQLGHIEKSAASMRIHELDIAELLKPVAATLGRLRDADAVEILERPAPEEVPQEVTPAPAQVEATPPVAREVALLEHLTTQQLVDRMIACGAELAKRRK